MNFCIFKSVVFDTNHSLWKKPLNQFEEKFFLVIFVCFWWIWLFCDLTFTDLDFVQNRSIYIGKWKDFGQYRSIYMGKVKAFWSISVDLSMEKSKYFDQYRQINTGKVKWFWSISTNLYRKSQKDHCQHLSIYIGKVKGFWSILVDLHRKHQRILVCIGRFIQKKSTDFYPHQSIQTRKVKGL